VPVDFDIHHAKDYGDSALISSLAPPSCRGQRAAAVALECFKKLRITNWTADRLGPAQPSRQIVLLLARRGILGQQIAIMPVVVVVEEGGRPAVAALGDVMRVTWEDGAGETSH